jgi:hypothetical protein
MTVGVGNGDGATLISGGGSGWTTGDGDKMTGGAVTIGGEDTMTESDQKNGFVTMIRAPDLWKNRGWCLWRKTILWSWWCLR